MSDPRNEIAIKITEKIETTLLRLFGTSADELVRHPNFWAIRENILATLKECVEILYYEIKYSPEQLAQMPKEHAAAYFKSRQREVAADAIEEIIGNKEFCPEWEYSSKDNWYKSKSGYIGIIKLGKLAELEKEREG